MPDPDATLREWRPLILTWATRKLRTYPGGRDLAEDVTQETCIALHRALPAYIDTGRPFAAFVFTIARRKLADAQRYGYRWQPETGNGEPSPTIPDQATPVLEVILTAEQHTRDARLLEQLLAPLPERSATILRLHAAELTAEQIGRRLGMTAGAVRVAQHRAMRDLRASVG